MERLAVRRCPGVELRMTYIDHGNIDGLFMVVSATTAWWFQISWFSRTQAMMLPTPIGWSSQLALSHGSETGLFI